MRKEGTDKQKQERIYAHRDYMDKVRQGERKAELLRSYQRKSNSRSVN